MFNVKNYDYRKFIKSVSSDVGSNKNVANLMAKSMNKTYLPFDNKRGALDRLFDALSVGQYVSAGIARGAARDDMTMFEGVIGGLRAANPLGKGYEKGEHSYSQFLDDVGWRPESTGGKIARGVVGFVGDVMLDPATYVSGGASALVKGTGKQGAKITHAVGEMTQELAEGIVKKQVLKRGLTSTADDIAKDAAKLVKQYNKIAGIRNSADDVTLSLANAPFGKKIFGKYAENSTTLIKGEEIKKISDAIGMSTKYSLLRDKVYGGKLGKLFSSKSKLYNLSKTQPEAVYDFMKFTEYTRGLTKDMEIAKKAIYDKAKTLNLTPDETKEVIEMMEDKSIWSTVKKYVNFSDTEEAKIYKKQTEAQKLIAEKELEELREAKKSMETLKVAKEEKLFESGETLSELRNEYRKKLSKIDIDKIEERGGWEELIKTLDEEIKQIDIEEAEFMKVANPKRDYVLGLYDEYADMDDAFKKSNKGVIEKVVEEKKLNGVYNEDLKTFVVKPDNVDDSQFDDVIRELNKKGHVTLDAPKKVTTTKTVQGKFSFVKPDDVGDDDYRKLIKSLADGGYLRVKPDEIEKLMNGEISELTNALIDKPFDVSYANYNKIHKQLHDKGYFKRVTTQVPSSEIVDKVSDFLSKYPDWTSEFDISSGKYNLTPPLKQSDTLVKTVKETVSRPNKTKLVQNISDYVFDNPDMISQAAWDGYIDNVADMIRRDTPMEEIVRYINKNSNFFDGRANMIYPYAGRQIGYESWKEEYEIPMAKLREKWRNGTITPDEMRQKAKLEKDFIARDEILKKFKYMETDDIKKLVDKEYDETHSILRADEIETLEDTSELEDMFYKEHRPKKPYSEVRTDRFTAEDRALNEMANPDTPSVKNFRTGEFDEPKGLINRAKITWNSDYFTSDRFEFREMLIEKLVPDKKLSELSNTYRKTFDLMTDEAENVLNTKFGKEYKDLTPKQKELLRDLTIKSYNNKFNPSKAPVKISKKELTEAITKRNDKYRTIELSKQIKAGATVQLKDGDGVVQLLKLNGDDLPVVDIIKADGTVLKDVELKDIVKFKNDVPRLSTDDVIGMSKTAQEFVEKRSAIMKDVDFIKSKISKLDDVYQDKYNNLFNDFVNSAEEVKQTIHNVEIDVQKIQDEFVKGDISKIDELTANIKHYEDVLSSDDAFETYIRSTLGDESVEEIISKNSPDVATTILNPDISVSEKVRDVVTQLRQSLVDIGETEVEIGKLKAEQFENFMYEYLPHILTDDGKKLFSNVSEIEKKIPGFGDAMGFGREFNEFSISRTIKKIPDGADGFIHNPNVMQVNEYLKREFNDVLKGKNAFSENIADIYVTRALKNNKLIYDTKYMDEMLEVFGSDVVDGTVKEGFSNVMNYGKLKQKTLEVANIRTGIQISDAVSEYLSGDGVMRGIQDIVDTRMGKLSSQKPRSYRQIQNQFMSEEIGKAVNKFLKENYSDAVRKGMKKANMDGFLGGGAISGYLDDMAMPMLGLDKHQYSWFKDELVSVQEDILTNVRGRQVGNKQYKGGLISINTELLRESRGGFAKLSEDVQEAIGSMNIDETREHIDTLVSTLSDARINRDGRYDVMLGRLDRMKNKLSKYDEIGEMQIKSVNDAIVQKANQSRKLQIEKDHSRFLQIYDKFTHLIKLNQTTILPSFHARNKYSNTFNNWLAIGGDAVNVDFQKKSFMAMKNNGVVDGVLKITKADGSIDSIKWSEIYNMAKEYGVIDDGFFAKDLGVGVESKGIFKKIPSKFDPTDTKNFIAYKKGAEIGGLIENQDKLLHFASQLSRGMGVDDAAESVQKFLFDYSDLTAFEQSTMKRIIPYYTWLRKNSALQMDMILQDPKKYQLVAKVMNGVEGMVDEDDKINKAFVNEFAKDWVQTPFNVTNPDGRKEPVLWNPNLPFMDIGRIPNPLDPINSAKELFTQMNPLIKTPIEQIMNKNMFFDSPIVKEDDNALAKRAEHVLGQNAAFPAIKGFIQKKGADRALHALNTTSGVKMLSYDYDKYKAMKIQDMIKNPPKDNVFDKTIDGVGRVLKAAPKMIVKGFANQVSKASNELADKANVGKPLKPDEYTDALRPISQSKYDKLSDTDKQMYTPPTAKEAIAYNKKAIEMEEKLLKESGIGKRVVWSLFDAFNLGERNKPFKIGEITEVTDGDTFKINIGGKTQPVRMLLIDTPESVGRDRSTGQSYEEEPMPYGKEASDYSKESLFGKDAKIYFDGDREDKYGRILGYVEIDGEDYNNKLLEEGLAQTRYIYDDNYDRLDKYRSTEKEASKRKKGIWSLGGYATPGVDADFKMNAIQRKLK